MKNRLNPGPVTFAIYILPSFLLYTFVVFVPILVAAYYGFFNWSGGTTKEFIGFDNYRTLLTDQRFWKALSNNLFLIVFCVIGQIGLAFVFAMLLESRVAKMKSFHRTVSFFPSVLSAVVIGFIWSMIYDYNYGLINTLLKSIGMKDKVQPWLSNEKLVVLLVTIPLIWQYVGYYLIIIISSIASVDTSIFEMAEIDGATGWKKAVYITLPLIKNTITVCITLCIAGNMKAFDHIWTLTGGGPGAASEVVALYAYKTSFASQKMGYGSAVSIGILVISLVFVGVIRVVMDRITKEKE